jgi:phosphoribosyl 1,2-cyclic phosphate phosphodiesterase
MTIVLSKIKPRGNCFMKITILGCGTSTGVPLPGCFCPVCTSDHPRNKRNRTSALITTDNGQNILIDTSPDLRHQAIQHQVKRIDAVLYTHAHADHILGLDDLRSFNFIQGRPIPCYGTEDTFREIRSIFRYVFERGSAYQGSTTPSLELNTIVPYEAFTVCGTEVLPFALFHGGIQVTGYRIGGLVYATDCNAVPTKSEELIRGTPLLFLDGLRYSPPHSTHYTIPEALEVIHRVQPAQAFLIHMTHAVDYEEVSVRLPNKVALAWDGMTLEFSAP